MKVYKIYSECMMGFEGDIEYKKSINKATKYFNDLIRKNLKEVEIVDKDDFGDAVSVFREWHEDCEIICRKYPLLIYKQNNKKIAVISYWARVSYEYQEYDIENVKIVLEEIEILD